MRKCTKWMRLHLPARVRFKRVCVPKHRYEPRFDGEGLGAEKHFAKTPCVAEAWSNFSLQEVINTKTFANEEYGLMNWAKTVRERQGRQMCEDDDEGVKADSKGSAPSCAKAAQFCSDPTNGPVVRKNCPKTCGTCTAPADGTLGRPMNVFTVE